VLKRFRPPGRKNKKSAAKPVPALSVHQPFAPVLFEVFAALAAHKFVESGTTIAVIEEEGSATLMVSSFPVV
jgi:hypothetical protein